LVFDTTQAPIAVEIPGHDDYWINQMVDDRTDTFGYVGHDTARGGVSKFVVYSDVTPAFDVPKFQHVQESFAYGPFLLRYLVRTPDSIDRIDEARQRIRVWKYGRGQRTADV